MKTLAITTALVASLAACSSDNTGTTNAPPPSDTTATQPTPPTAMSKCGKPGDLGNSQGVGKYCQSLDDCRGNQKATLCSKVGDPETFFCTKLCKADQSIESQCGEGMVCSCGGGGCGCTPKVCTE